MLVLRVSRGNEIQRESQGDVPGGPMVNICLPIHSVQVQSLVREQRSYMPQGRFPLQQLRPGAAKLIN